MKDIHIYGCSWKTRIFGLRVCTRDSALVRLCSHQFLHSKWHAGPWSQGQMYFRWPSDSVPPSQVSVFQRLQSWQIIILKEKGVVVNNHTQMLRVKMGRGTDWMHLMPVTTLLLTSQLLPTPYLPSRIYGSFSIPDSLAFASLLSPPDPDSPCEKSSAWHTLQQYPVPLQTGQPFETGLPKVPPDSRTCYSWNL